MRFNGTTELHSRVSSERGSPGKGDGRKRGSEGVEDTDGHNVRMDEPSEAREFSDDADFSRSEGDAEFGGASEGTRAGEQGVEE